MSATDTQHKQNKPLSEEAVRAVRRAYRPGVRLRKLEERFEMTGGAIISIANRCTYDEHESRPDEYVPPAHIRGTRRREPLVAPVHRESQPFPIRRTNTAHLTPEALQVIHEAIADGEPIPRIARSFGLAPEAIAHMKPGRR